MSLTGSWSPRSPARSSAQLAFGRSSAFARASALLYGFSSALPAGNRYGMWVPVEWTVQSHIALSDSLAELIGIGDQAWQVKWSEPTSHA